MSCRRTESGRGRFLSRMCVVAGLVGARSRRFGALVSTATSCFNVRRPRRFALILSRRASFPRPHLFPFPVAASLPAIASTSCGFETRGGWPTLPPLYPWAWNSLGKHPASRRIRPIYPMACTCPNDRRAAVVSAIFCPPIYMIIPGGKMLTPKRQVIKDG